MNVFCKMEIGPNMTPKLKNEKTEKSTGA